MHKVLVTAASFLSPLGNDLATLSRRLRAGESGVRWLTDREAPPGFPIRYAAKLELPREEGLELRLGRAASSYTHAASWLAKDLAKRIPLGLAIDAFGFFGREKNYYDLTLSLLRGEEATLRRLHLNSAMLPHRELRGFVAENTGARIGKDFFLGSACTSATVLLGIAFRRIRAGEWKRALLGTIEIDSNPLQLMGLHLIGALSTGFDDPARASRPFATGRNGLVKGEAATLILLESEEAMAERGAASLGEIAGYSNTSDAYQFAEGLPTGRELENAMRLAMSDAAVEPSEIGYVKAHATSTPTGDLIEAAAIARVFSGLSPAVNAPKSQLGHSTTACGSMECIAALAMMREGFLSPTLNLEVPDPEIAAMGLDLVGVRAREKKVSTALLNSGGFGGQNSCLVVRASGSR